MPVRWAPLVLLVLLFPFVAILLGGLRRALMLAVALDLALQLDVHLGYREEVARIGALGGLNLSVTTLALPLLYGLWLLDLARQHRQVGSSMPSGTVVSAVLFTLITAASVLVARDVGLGLFEVALVCQSLLLFLYIACTVRTAEDLQYLVSCLLAGVLVLSSLVIAVRLLGDNGLIGGLAVGLSAPVQRAAGPSGSPNTTAAYLSLFLAPALSLLLSQVGSRLRLLASAALLVGTLALVLTLSRGGWLATAASMVVVLVVFQRRQVSVGALWLLGALSLLLLPLLAGAVLGRLLGDDQGAAAGRLPLLELSWRMIADNPLVGVGANNYVLAARDYLTPEFSRAWFYVVHNAFLRIWVEMGLPGLLSYLGLLFFSIVYGLRSGSSRDDLLAALGIGFSAAIIGHITQLNVDVMNGRLPVQSLWMIAGLVTAVAAVERQRVRIRRQRAPTGQAARAAASGIRT